MFRHSKLVSEASRHAEASKKLSSTYKFIPQWNETHLPVYREFQTKQFLVHNFTSLWKCIFDEWDSTIHENTTQNISVFPLYNFNTIKLSPLIFQYLLFCFSRKMIKLSVISSLGHTIANANVSLWMWGGRWGDSFLESSQNLFKAFLKRLCLYFCLDDVGGVVRFRSTW